MTPRNVVSRLSHAVTMRCVMPIADLGHKTDKSLRRKKAERQHLCLAYNSRRLDKKITNGWNITSYSRIKFETKINQLNCQRNVRTALSRQSKHKKTEFRNYKGKCI